jgi:hypothetical protein
MDGFFKKKKKAHPLEETEGPVGVSGAKSSIQWIC